MDKFVDLNSFITWIIYSGGALLIASWVLDNIPKFGILASKTKKFINIAVALLLAYGCYATIVYVPANILLLLDPWFKIGAGIVTLYSAQQVVHRMTKI